MVKRLCGNFVSHTHGELITNFEDNIKTAASAALKCQNDNIFCIDGDNFTDCVIGSETKDEALQVLYKHDEGWKDRLEPDDLYQI